MAAGGPATLKRTEFKNILKEKLKSPDQFRRAGRYIGKANVSQNCRKYASFDFWEEVLDNLQVLNKNEKVFHELIVTGQPVKPYFDLEWYENDAPGVHPDEVLYDIMSSCIQLFAEYNTWEVELKRSDFRVASCCRVDSNRKSMKF
jgi:hypothetical protein